MFSQPAQFLLTVPSSSRTNTPSPTDSNGITSFPQSYWNPSPTDLHGTDLSAWIAGPVFGTMVAAALVDFLIFWFYRRRKKLARVDEDKEIKATVSKDVDPIPSHSVEAGDAAVYEMDGEGIRGEADGDAMRREMEGDAIRNEVDEETARIEM